MTCTYIDANGHKLEPPTHQTLLPDEEPVEEPHIKPMPTIEEP